MINKVLLYISHQFQRKLSGEDTGILCLVFFENICLYCSSNGGECTSFDLAVNIFRQHIFTTQSEQPQSQSIVTGRQGSFE